MFAFHSIATELQTSPEVRLVPIVLKKSFLADEPKFLGPLMRFVRGDVRDHIVSPKIDQDLRGGARALQRRRDLKINFREILGVVRFSTFATVSAMKRHARRFSPNLCTG
jgi:hypothetical protein